MELTSLDSNQRRGILEELRNRVSVLTYPERAVVNQELGLLAYLVAKYDDPLCALCSHPRGGHAINGDWCPNPASEDQLFNYSQKFVADLQSLRKGA